MKRTRLFILMMSVVIVSCDSESDKNDGIISGEGIFTSQVDNSTIEGELFLPDGDGPFPVLIAVPGSGNETRVEMEPFAPIFNSFGYGLYIYDKRGLGGSTGSYPIETIENPFDFLSARADDVISIVNFLKGHTDVETSKIGLFGASQGTWVNMIVHSKIQNDVGLLIMSSGGAASTRVEHYYEELISEGLSVADANQRLFDYSGDLGYDPMPVLELVEVPTLFVFGGKDRSHPTLYDNDLIQNLQKSNFIIHFYENANHSLIDEGTKSFPADLFSEIGNWLELND